LSRRAVFLDRDGTLVHARHYPKRPEDLRLYRGVAKELRTVQEAGYAPVVITNQGGLAFGYFSEFDLQAMHVYLRQELEREGVELTDIYYCPHHPKGRIPKLSIACDCRKPKPGMLFRAAAEHDIDLTQSWFIGDILDDVEAGNSAGCRTVLVDLGTEKRPRSPRRIPTFIARNTVHALQIVRAEDGREQADLGYRPASWNKAARGSTNRYLEEAQHVAQ